MVKISAAIQLGARTFLSAEYRVVAIFMIPAAIAVGLANGFTNAGWMGGISKCWCGPREP
jgi:Na+/H+-translocating membrane pyrophosphatase